MTLLRVLLAGALLLTVMFGIWEVRRWQIPSVRELISRYQRRLRMAGLFFLLLTLALWLYGTWIPVPAHHAHSRIEREAALHFVTFWTVTTVCALPLIPLALLDSRENLRRLSRERRALVQETLGTATDRNTDR